ncbi:MAG: AMP-binding protein [Bacteroidaceae bacterium]|nr:AMP-binding protein [Bacteroidaceae bacterium]MBR4516346.1 AMP-binding protein [Bacteroidaceae bacterium]
METVQVPSYNKMIQQSIHDHWFLNSMSDYGESTLLYKDVARIIEKMHILFEQAGIQHGDKIALCGRNLSRWGAAFLSILTYGAVAVPILHEFHPSQVHDIVNHSESKLLFVGDKVWPKLKASEMPALEGIISLADYSLLECRNDKLSYARENLNRLFGERFPYRFLPELLNYYQDQPDEMAVLNYTSGTTSKSKGVMIPYRSLWSNCDFAQHVLGKEIKAGTHVLSMLPMAHMYGMAFEFTYEFMRGVHIHFLTKMASPTILMKALADVKPIILIVVPLIIEKVVRKAVLPKIQDPKVRLLMSLPVIGDRIRKRICDGLTQALGGNFYEVIIGGAALNQEIEQLLHEIGFRYTVGYGATECAPIITYSDWKDQLVGSCGRNVIHQELRVVSPDPENIPGEILTRGLNVMLGYFKNEEATRTTLDEDGWYHTGDLGIIRDGHLFIKGRSKNMLLGANGQNIYPEEIEDKLSSMMLVGECLVVQRDEKLVGLVYPDPDEVKKLGLSRSEIEAIMEQNRKDVNPSLPAYAQISSIKIMDEEFEKTPKKSIKRFLYT